MTFEVKINLMFYLRQFNIIIHTMFKYQMLVKQDMQQKVNF